METIRQNSSRMLVLALCGTLLVLELFIFFSANTSAKGIAMPPQHDTLIYMQYARAIAEGHPYCFTPGDAPTTASTSHLYPFLLAIPYVLGAHGEALYVASLLFNIVFLLLIVALVWVIARRLTPETVGYAVFLAALSGPLAYAVLQQSDMGFFTVVILAFFAALLYERYKLAGVLLALTVWGRPDGSVVAAAVLGYGIVARWHPLRRRIFFLGLWGCGNVMAVFLLNKILTGSFLFQSLTGKGYLSQFPFAGAIICICMDFRSLITGFLLGLDASDRQLYMIPLVGGLLALAGLFGRLARTEDRTTASDGCWTICALGSLVMVATSGWQGFNYDRHLAWFFPFLAIYTASGIQLVKKTLPRWPVWHLVGVSLLVYQIAMLPTFAVFFAKNLQHTVSRMEVVSRAHRLLPLNKRINVISFSGAAYLMPGRTFIHVGGFGSSRFVTWHGSEANVEVLRRHPELRGDYWIMERDHTLDYAVSEPFIGREVMTERNYFPTVQTAQTVYETNWSSLMAPRIPLATNAIAAVQGWQLMDELDVGYEVDEKTHAYRIYAREPNVRLAVFIATCNVGGHRVTEAARLVMGSDTFRIHAVPGHDVRMVVRTSAIMFDKRAKYFDMPADTANIKIGPRLRWQVDVDGVDAGIFDVTISTNETAWSEVVLDVPGKFIHRSNPRLAISGDHVAAYYWFYQMPDEKRP
jgi:hypothetical protein